MDRSGGCAATALLLGLILAGLCLLFISVKAG